MKILLALLSISAFAQNTAIFPGAIATNSDLLISGNRYRAVLTATVNASTLTLPVNSLVNVHVPGTVEIGTETVKICGTGTLTLTVCTGGRGFDGTTGASHANGSSVMGTPGDWKHNQLAAEVKALESAVAGLSPSTSIVNLLGYGALCDGVTNDTVAVQAVEALSAQVITIPVGTCMVTQAVITTLTKHYVGYGKLESISALAKTAPDQVTVRTKPSDGGGVSLGNFQGDQRNVDARYFETSATSAIATFGTSYYNYEINPVYIQHKSNSGSGDVVAWTHNQSLSGQKILTVNATSWASAGQTVSVAGDMYVIATIQAGVSLTMVTNLTTNYGTAGDSVKTALYRANRTSQSTFFAEHWNSGGGDSQAFFSLMYADATAASGVTHASFTGSTTLLGGSITVTKDWNMPIGSEILFTDVDYLGNTKKSLAIGDIRNFNRYLWAGQVSTAGTAVTWLSGGKFDTAWLGGGATVVQINGSNYGISSVTDSTHLVLMSTAGTQTNVYYRVDPAGSVNGSWTGSYYTCNGTQYCEAIMYGVGKWKEGIALSGLTLATGEAAIVLGPYHKVYMNGSTTNDSDVGYALWAKTPGDTYFYYNPDPALLQWQWWTGGVQSMALTGGGSPTLYLANLNVTTSITANGTAGADLTLSCGGGQAVKTLTTKKGIVTAATCGAP